MSNVAKLKKKAVEFEQKKQYDKALALYVQALEEATAAGDEEPEVALYNRVGDLQLRLGNGDEAVRYYTQAVELYTEAGFLNNAIALCNKILRHDPSQAGIYYTLGRISARKGFRSDAKHYFLAYAERMQRAGQLDESFRALKEFADLCPDQDDIRLMLAEQLSKQGRGEEAVEQLQALHERLTAEGRASEARATAERMQAIDPTVVPRLSSGGAAVASENGLVFLDVSYDDGHAPGRKPQSGSRAAVGTPGASATTARPTGERAAAPPAANGTPATVPSILDSPTTASAAAVAPAPLAGLEPTAVADAATLSAPVASLLDPAPEGVVREAAAAPKLELDPSPGDAASELPAGAAAATTLPTASEAGFGDRTLPDLVPTAIAAPPDDADSGPAGSTLELVYPEPEDEEADAPPADAARALDGLPLLDPPPEGVTGRAPEPKAALAGEALPPPLLPPLDLSAFDSLPPAAPLPAPELAHPGTGEGGPGFVNLGDWLRDTETPRSTRMVTDAMEPEEGEEFDFEDMLRRFKRGVAENVDADDHDSHYDLGVAFKEMGLVDEAIAEFQKALRGQRQRLRSYEALGQCFVDKAQHQVATTVLTRALAEPEMGDEQLVGVLYLLGTATEALGRPDDAIAYYQRVFAVDIEFRDVADRLNALERTAR